MRIVIFLNGARGISVLSHILGDARFEVPGVVTPLAFSNRPLAALQAANHFAHLQLADVNAHDSCAALRSFHPDVFLIAGFSTIFRAQLLQVPVMATLNLHAGRLPAYRGGSPLNWQLVNGETSAGVSVIRVEEGIDSGPIMAESSFPIGPRDTIAQLHHKANGLFPQLAVKALQCLVSNNSSGRAQPEIEAQYWHQRTDADGRINFGGMPATAVDRMVRAITRPYPGAFAYSGSHKVRVYSAEIPALCLRGVPGRICYVMHKGPYIICADKAILVTDYQIESQPHLKLTHGNYLA